MMESPGAAPAFLLVPGRPRPACVGRDPQIFFKAAGNEINRAKAICRTCLLLPECRAWALTRPPRELYGVWGGMSRRDRSVFHRAQRTKGSEPQHPGGTA